MSQFDVNSFCQRRAEFFGWAVNQLVYTHPDTLTLSYPRQNQQLTTEEIMQLFYCHLADSLRELNAISLERNALERSILHAPPKAE